MPMAQVDTPEFVFTMINQFTINRFDFLDIRNRLNDNLNDFECNSNYTRLISNRAIVLEL